MYNDFASRLEQSWKTDPRWADVERPYSADDVLHLRSTLQIEYTLARHGAERLWELLKTEPYVRTLGAQTGAQAVQMVQAGLKAIYVSGWQVAGDMNTAGQTYPDQSLYPVDSVPTLIRRINNALQRSDEISHNAGISDRMPYWYAPLVADAEAGFGGVLNAFELTKALIEAGAAAVHFEDQLSSAKKCGHMGGKVLVSTQEAIDKLVAARLASDVLDVPTVIIARTDALGADLLTNDIDRNDKRFIIGERTTEGFYLVRSGIEQAISRGLAYAPYADMVWCETATPNIDEAQQFAEGIHDRYPNKMLAYNCSPSFNWQRMLTNEQIATFQRNLALMGYKFQFVTLAGFHALNLSMFELAHAYRDKGMLAYSRFQQREFELEKEHGYRAVKHQAFVGAGYFDSVAQVISSGRSSTAAMRGSTEQVQFTEKTPVFSVAEIHHAASEDLISIPPTTNLVSEPKSA
jgi:isocitrate lyase